MELTHARFSYPIRRLRRWGRPHNGGVPERRARQTDARDCLQPSGRLIASKDDAGDASERQAGRDTAPLREVRRTETERGLKPRIRERALREAVSLCCADRSLFLRR